MEHPEPAGGVERIRTDVEHFEVEIRWKAWKAAGLRPITLHGPRHAAASYLIEAGLNTNPPSPTTHENAQFAGR